MGSHLHKQGLRVLFLLGLPKKSQVLSGQHQHQQRRLSRGEKRDYYYTSAHERIKGEREEGGI